MHHYPNVEAHLIVHVLIESSRRFAELLLAIAYSDLVRFSTPYSKVVENPVLSSKARLSYRSKYGKIENDRLLVPRQIWPNSKSANDQEGGSKVNMSRDFSKGKDKELENNTVGDRTELKIWTLAGFFLSHVIYQ